MQRKQNGHQATGIRDKGKDMNKDTDKGRAKDRNWENPATPGSCSDLVLVFSSVSIRVLLRYSCDLTCQQLQMRSLSTRAKVSQQDLHQDPNPNRPEGDETGATEPTYMWKAVILQAAAIFED
ncbi:GM10232 [Drosophila sechellia]|uniref:GM10232 n=1 Tax=Drosophila sechellia TaxID=7238 RepID=B4ICB6_DROSE|nr:GM10232 [Drosophila sechellia]